MKALISALKTRGDELGSWSFLVRPDHPPAIAFGDELTETNQHSIKIPFTVVDDYGGVTAKAVIDLRDAVSEDALNGDMPPIDEQALIDAEMAACGTVARYVKTPDN